MRKDNNVNATQVLSLLNAFQSITDIYKLKLSFLLNQLVCNLAIACMCII